MELGLKGKRVLITGASRGIGSSIAKSYMDEGAFVTLVAREEDKLKQVLSSSTNQKSKNQSDYIIADLRAKGSPTVVAEEVLKRHSYIEIIIHNVGGALGRKNLYAGLSDWLDVWNYNLGIPIEINNILAPIMEKKNWGRIVHISSISADLGEPLIEPYGGAIPYASAKAALNAYIKGLSRELAKKKIVVSGLMPGAIRTEGKYWDKILDSDPDLAKKFLKEYYPVGRFGSPKEIASFAVFLGSELASFASGSIIPISGGRI
jgi:3-oxoacyl-[acyl-carrier protein] reductase